jgi:hypothetical protein
MCTISSRYEISEQQVIQSKVTAACASRGIVSHYEWCAMMQHWKGIEIHARAKQKQPTTQPYSAFTAAAAEEEVDSTVEFLDSSCQVRPVPIRFITSKISKLVSFTPIYNKTCH